MGEAPGSNPGESIGATEFYEGVRMGEMGLESEESQRRAERGDRLPVVKIQASQFFRSLRSLSHSLADVPLASLAGLPASPLAFVAPSPTDA